MPIPAHLSFTEAAAIPEVFLTAFQALHWLGSIQKGERVLIHAGGSGVGTAAIQLAKRMEAEIYTTASAPKLAACQQLGAQHLIDYRSQSFESVIQEQTGGKGVDIILDFIAAPYLQANVNSLGMDGRLILLALMGGIKASSFNMLPILKNRIQLKGTTLRARALAYKQKLVADFRSKYFHISQRKAYSRL